MRLKIPNPIWLQKAKCRGGITADFYPGSSGHPASREEAERATRNCNGCPVKKECLLDELLSVNSMHEILGVRAGMTAAARRKSYTKLLKDRL